MNLPLSAPVADRITPLVRRAAAGEADAFASLVASHCRLAGAVAYGVLGDFDLAEDAVQEAFVRVWRDLPHLKDPSTFKSWLCTVVRRAAFDVLRERAPITDSESPLTEERSGDGSAPDEALAQREEAALVSRLVQALPASYREPLVLYYLLLTIPPWQIIGGRRSCRESCLVFGVFRPAPIRILISHLPSPAESFSLGGGGGPISGWSKMVANSKSMRQNRPSLAR